MPRYAYVAVDVNGRQRSGGLDAPSEQDARAQLARRKLAPVRVAAEAATPANDRATARVKSAPTTGQRLNHRERVLVARQLATLVGAAIPVEEALGILAMQQDSARVRAVVADVQAGVKQGLRLADALGRHGDSFPPGYRAAIAGAERAGNLGDVLTRLADHMTRERALRVKVLTAMIYPAALMTVAALVVTALMVFVVPTLVEQFRGFEGHLPLLTQILIGVSYGLTHYWPYLLAAVALAFMFIRMALSNPSTRLGIDAAALRLPVVGRRLRAINTSRLVREVGTLIASGLPVPEAVHIAAASTHNRFFARAAREMAVQIERGEALSAALRRSAVTPAMVVHMAASGEAAGKLSMLLEKAADQLDQETESFLQAALSLLEPAIILLMGAMVAGIVLAIMLPILQLNTLAIG